MRRAVVTAVAACAGLSGCIGDYTPNGPTYRVQQDRMRRICEHRGGVRAFHQTIYNNGAAALMGGIEFTCNDGYADTLEWDMQGPDHL